MRKKIISCCYACQEKIQLNFLERTVVNNEDVLLCRSCHTYFERNDYTEQPIRVNLHPVICEKCRRSELFVNIHEVLIGNDLKCLCLICESLINKQDEQGSKGQHRQSSAQPKKISKSTKVIIPGIIIIAIALLAFMKSPFFTTQQEANYYLQQHINPSNELMNEIYTHLYEDDYTVRKLSSSQIDQFVIQLNEFSTSTHTNERALQPLQQNLQARIQSMRELLLATEVTSYDFKQWKMNNTAIKMEWLYEEYEQLLTELFHTKNMPYVVRADNSIQYQYQIIERQP